MPQGVLEEGRAVKQEDGRYELKSVADEQTVLRKMNDDMSREYVQYCYDKWTQYPWDWSEQGKVYQEQRLFNGIVHKIDMLTKQVSRVAETLIRQESRRNDFDTQPYPGETREP